MSLINISFYTSLHIFMLFFYTSYNGFYIFIIFLQYNFYILIPFAPFCCYKIYYALSRFNSPSLSPPPPLSLDPSIYPFIHVIYDTTNAFRFSLLPQSTDNFETVDCSSSTVYCQYIFSALRKTPNVTSSLLLKIICQRLIAKQNKGLGEKNNM